jgi:hypothetical protein
MDHDRSTHLLDRQLDELSPSADAHERMRRRVDEHVRLAGTAGVRAPRHAPRIARGAVLTGAAAIAVAFAFALAPGTSTERGDSGIGPQSAAAQELIDAGQAAADAAWTPLRDGDLYRVYRTTWSPDGDHDAAGSLSDGATTSESWIDRNGNGMDLIVVGAGRLDRAPSTYRDPRTGQIRGMGPTRAAPGSRLSDQESLASPDAVDQLVWPRDGARPFQRGWVRTTDGYELSHQSDLDEGSSGDWYSPEHRIQMLWGMTVAELDALDAASDRELPARVSELIERAAQQRRTNEIPGNRFGVTVRQLERELQIETAVSLLGQAPIAPRARREIFEWLAGQPGARLERNAIDGIGRTGARITFARAWRDDVPARTVTAGELLQESRDAGVREISGNEPITTMAWDDKRTRGMLLQHVEDVPHDTEYRVPAHREARTWSVELIVDPDTGELLQHVTRWRESSTRGVPKLRYDRDGSIQIDYQPGGRNSSGGGGSQLILAREVTSSITPSSPVCAVRPVLCRPSRAAG